MMKIVIVIVIVIIIIISTQQSTHTIISIYYRIRESSQRSRHNKYPKSSKISPHSQIVNKIHFNIITLSMSKYQKLVLTSGVPTEIMRAFLKYLVRATSSDYPKRVTCYPAQSTAYKTPHGAVFVSSVLRSEHY